jgi:hypothetical protein
MKKLSFLAVALTALVFAACGGKKTAQDATDVDSTKSFEQKQIEASIKMHFDSLAAELGRLKKLPVSVNKETGVIKLTDQEKQVKPDYLLNAAIADNATTLSEKYRTLAALQVDREVALLYDMPLDEYDKAIAKLAADINDPSFKAIDDTGNIHETSQVLYKAMDENGRINYFWQLVATALVENLYVTSQNTDKFITAFDDDAAANVTFRIILLQDAVARLSEYDTDIIPVAKAIEPLTVLNATTVDELKAQLGEAKEKIAAARAALIK